VDGTGAARHHQVMRDFDPIRLGGYEADAWVAYYQRRWGTFLRASLGLVREGFGLPGLANLRGAWWVMRANQAWAPYPANDPDTARAYMRRFYQLVVARNHETFDVDEAARLEVEWWRLHRFLQREAPDGSVVSLDDLTDGLAALYAHVYRVPVADVRVAASHRAAAMQISDAWVAAGARAGEPAIAEERAELVRGYTLLRTAVVRPGHDQEE
jgi:hypothetical protein